MCTLYQLILLSAFFHTIYSLSCLVIRPGYGLVSEQCPVQAVGCRIKVRGDLVEWYEWAKLYDRNQLVCVFPGEYGQASGCQRKASGSVRCWCGGEEDCNTAENSKRLYIDFTGGVDMTASSSRRKYQKQEPTTAAPTTAAPVTTTEQKTTRKILIKKLETRPAIYTPAPKKLTTSTIKTTEITEITDKAVDAEPTYILPTVGVKPYIVTIPVKTKGKKIMPHDHHKQIEKPYALPTEASLDIVESVKPSDSIFEETRRKLEEEMKLEEERLKEILEDDKNEESMDEPEDYQRTEEKERQKNRTAAKSKEKAKMERRERARLEEIRRQQEEERLATMDREEAEAEERKMTMRDADRESDDDYQYEGFGFEAKKALNSSGLHGIGLAAISLLSVIVLRLL